MSDPGHYQPTTRTAHSEDGAACSRDAKSHRDFRRVCPNCSAELWDKECKSRCPRCHFFTDCSDPW